jgi:hypothetical protein
MLFWIFMGIGTVLDIYGDCYAVLNIYLNIYENWDCFGYLWGLLCCFGIFI